MGRAVSTRMRLRTAQLSAAVTIFLAISSIAGAQARKKKPVAQPAPLPCGDLVGFQVLLDRKGFSSGEIDGKPGPNFSRALAAFQAARKLAAGQPGQVCLERGRPVVGHTESDHLRRDVGEVAL